MKRLIIGVIVVLASWPVLIASVHGAGQHTPPTPPPDGETIGERNPIVAAAAALGIILTGVAGIYIYRIIKKGL